MFIMITLVSIVSTIVIYLFSRKISEKYRSPFTTPVFFSTTIIITLLLVTGISYDQYEPAKDIMTYLLGPATVALAVPLYKNRKLILQYSLTGGVGLASGLVTTILSIVVIAKIFQLTDPIIASLTVKSATIPIAIEITQLINGDPSLSVAFVVATGTIGGMLGPWLLDKTNISNPISRGLSMGTIAHGQGAAEIAREGQLQGAMAGMAMGVAAVLMSVFVPILFRLIN